MRGLPPPAERRRGQRCAWLDRCHVRSRLFSGERYPPAGPPSSRNSLSSIRSSPQHDPATAPGLAAPPNLGKTSVTRSVSARHDHDLPSRSRLLGGLADQRSQACSPRQSRQGWRKASRQPGSHRAGRNRGLPQPAASSVIAEAAAVPMNIMAMRFTGAPFCAAVASAGPPWEEAPRFLVRCVYSARMPSRKNWIAPAPNPAERTLSVPARVLTSRRSFATSEWRISVVAASPLTFTA